MLLLTAAATLSSFTHRPGGEGFEIFLDQQLLVQRFGADINTVQPLSLTSQQGGNLFIKYYHCGKTGTGRTLTVKNNRNEVLREFRFADSHSGSSVMQLPVKDISTLAPKGSDQVQLYYSSAELKDGKLLTRIQF